MDLIGALDRLATLPKDSIEYIDAMDPGFFIYSIPMTNPSDDSLEFRIIVAIDAEFVISRKAADCGPAIAITVNT